MSGWDEGQVSAAQVHYHDEDGRAVEAVEPMGGGDPTGPLAEFAAEHIDAEELTGKFAEFLRVFSLDNDFIYREQLRRNVTLGQFTLEVELSHVGGYDADLGAALRARPDDVLPLFEVAAGKVCQEMAVSGRAQEMLAQYNMLEEEEEFFDTAGGASTPPIHIQLVQCSIVPTPIRELNPQHVGKLVSVPGIVISASRTHAKVTHISIQCRYCGDVQKRPCKPGFSTTPMPKECVRQQAAGGANEGAPESTCGPNPYLILGDKSCYMDQQTLKLQESLESIPTGEIPRHLMLSADRYCVGRAVPGTRVVMTGIYSVYRSKSKDDKKQRGGGGGGVAVRNPYLQIVGVVIDSDGAGRSQSMFTREDEQKFVALSKRPGLYEMIANSIAPAIYGHGDVKKAIACLLFGGSRKVLPDSVRLRGDINVLLLGDPGTAKSQFLKFVEKVAPIGVYTSGKGSSAAGLTASVIRDASTKEFYLEGGAMVLADGGVVCIDEFDKMHTRDRVAIHEAMEQQTISIAKAGITTILNARSSVLAAANPVFGSYDSDRSQFENIEFQSTILSRFDMIFLVKDTHNPQRDNAIAEHVIDIHVESKTSNSSGGLDPSLLKQYVAFARAKCAPRLTPQAANALKNHYVSIRSSMRSREQGAAQAIPITVRQLEAIVRISESLAKMTLSPVATESHVNEAIRLFRNSTLDAALAGVAAAENMSPEVLQEVSSAESLLRRRLPIGARTSLKRIIQELQKQGPSEFAIRKAVAIMAQRDEVQYQNQRKMVYRLR